MSLPGGDGARGYRKPHGHGLEDSCALAQHDDALEHASREQPHLDRGHEATAEGRCAG